MFGGAVVGDGDDGEDEGGRQAAGVQLDDPADEVQRLDALHLVVHTQVEAPGCGRGRADFSDNSCDTLNADVAFSLNVKYIPYST